MCIVLPMYPMPQPFKRTATSPLISEFDKKPKLGLTDEERKKLTTKLQYLSYLPVSTPEHVMTDYLALAFQVVANYTYVNYWQVLDGSELRRGTHRSAVTQGSARVRLHLAWSSRQRRLEQVCKLCGLITPFKYSVWQDSRVGWGLVTTFFKQAERERSVFLFVCRMQPSLIIILLSYSNYGVMGHCICWQRTWYAIPAYSALL